LDSQKQNPVTIGHFLDSLIISVYIRFKKKQYHEMERTFRHFRGLMEYFLSAVWHLKSFKGDILKQADIEYDNDHFRVGDYNSTIYTYLLYGIYGLLIFNLRIFQSTFSKSISK
jgi:hypothetical protein